MAMGNKKSTPVYDDSPDIGGPISVGVNDSKGKISYEIPSSLWKKNMTFSIKSIGSGQERGYLIIEGTIRHESEPFRAGAVVKTSEELSSDGYFVVTVKTNGNTSLADYFR